MDTSPLSPDDLARIEDVATLLELLQDKLGWELDVEDVTDIDDVTYDWEPNELPLKPEHRAKLREIKQLRPFESDQGWAVFFVSFESEGRLPVTVLRRLLRGLTLKGRNASAQNSAWNLHDLLFISAFGKGAERELAFAHFHEEEGGDLPRLSVLGWDEADTDRRKALTAERLAGLSYEPDEETDARRDRWRQVFQGTKRQTITDSRTLARELATLAAAIRGRVNELIGAEAENGHLRKMHLAFQRTLIEGLSADEFADTFAQTVAYGLLTAAFSRPSGALVMQDLVHMVPATNPFLRGLFERFLNMGGQDHGKLLDYDELGLRDVIDLLQAADLQAVRADFGTRKPGEDPVIHFYEDFLSAYDKQQKVDAGVFYTPQPVVNFIVRGVDQMLREEFGLPLGIADRATLGEVAARLPGVTVPDGQGGDQAFVRILDPATGTGTFLVETIELIHARMMEHWAGESEESRRALWQSYVAGHLLPNMSAFELKMAPYAIAHMKVGLKLQDTGYDLAAGERLRVYLTNAMHPAREVEQREMDFDVEVLAEEADAANAAKRERHSVVLGNPPYKGESQNPSKDKKGKLTFAGKLIRPYFQVDGKPLGERNPKWINNDYVKFLRFAEWTVERAGGGAIGYITSNSWLDAPTFRGVRAHLLKTFDALRIIDLHGNISKRETAPDGSSDVGVFDIEEGVNITLATYGEGKAVRQVDLLGPRGDLSHGKFEWLLNSNMSKVLYSLEPDHPMFFLVPVDNTYRSEYDCQTTITEIFPTNSVGIATANDAATIHFTRSEIEIFAKWFRDNEPLDAERARSFQNEPEEWRITVDSANFSYGLANKPEAKDWSVELARSDLTSNDNLTALATSVRYRPFDVRWTIYSGRSSGFLCRPRPEVMNHLLSSETVSLLSSRMTKGEDFAHVHIATEISEVIGLSGKTSNNAFAFPLFLRSTPTEPRRPNVSPAFARSLATRTGLAWVNGLPRTSSQGGQLNLDALTPPNQPDLMDQGAPSDWDGRVDLSQGFGPRDLFDYIYAVLHAPSYRDRYAEFLRSDFPRIPLPGGDDPSALFRALTTHGRRLSALHLLDVDAMPELQNPAIRLAGTGSTQLGKKGDIDWQDGKVSINGDRWFETVPEEAWNFRIGGYQPAQKWLKDRAEKGGQNPCDGRILTDDDILHYRRFVTAMQLTIPEMAAVDDTIASHGGWPDAFAKP